MEKNKFIFCLIYSLFLLSSFQIKRVETPYVPQENKVLVFMGENWGVFYESESKKFHAIQYLQMPNIQFSDSLLLQKLSDSCIAIKDVKKGTINHFRIGELQKNDQPVFGIISFEGDDYQTQFLTYHDGQVELNQSVLARGSHVLNCNCQPKGSPTYCEQGGEGSTDFSSFGSYNGKSTSISASCQRGYFACYVTKR